MFHVKHFGKAVQDRELGSIRSSEYEGITLARIS